MTDKPARAVELSENGIRIQGEPVVLLCASLFYFRIPRDDWRDRMRKLRRMGYNAIDVYFPWNYHEWEPGQWDFSGQRDAGAFLDMAGEEGLHVVARPGPYICSEWDGGSIPAWLSALGPGKLRQADPDYLAHVERWYGRILPLIRDREAGRGGSVVAVQLENELDFYDCRDPGGYMAALRDMALRHGLRVPLIACAGQGDLARAGGEVEGVVPTCNFYPRDRDPEFDRKAKDYAFELQARGVPLMVTETNRSHFVLRRLLASGAKLLGPYLQVSGIDFGFTNAAGNWGDPIGFLVSDYDFGGMISPEGHLRPEACEGRRLGRLLACYGPRLAAAMPMELGPSADAEGITGVQALLLADGGFLLGLPNVGGAAEVRVAASNESFVVRVPEGRCPLLPVGVALEPWGMEGKLVRASAELFHAEIRDGRARDFVFAADGPAEIVLDVAVRSVEAQGGLRARAPYKGRVAIEGTAPGSVVLTLADGARVAVHLVPEEEAGRLAGIGEDGNPAMDAPVAAEPTPVPAPERWRAARHGMGSPIGRPWTPLGDRPGYLEEAGVLRGYAWYEAELPGAGPARGLMLENASDIVSVYQGSRYIGTVVPGGGTRYVPFEGVAADAGDADERGPGRGEGQAAERIRFRVEVWGHSNFDDPRLPALRLLAPKGLTGAARIDRVRNVSGNWRVAMREPGDDGTDDVDPGTDVRRWPVVSWGGWMSTRRPHLVTYRRTIRLSEEADAWYLAFPDCQTACAVYANGVLVGELNPFTPTIGLRGAVSAGEEAVIAVRMERHLGESPGRVQLLEGRAARDWRLASAQEERLWEDALACGADAAEVSYRSDWEPGETGWLYMPDPGDNAGRGWTVRVSGRNLKLTAFVNGVITGRLWLPGEGRPRMVGGRTDLFHLPGALLRPEGNRIALLAEAVHAAEKGRLAEVFLCPVREE